MLLDLVRPLHIACTRLVKNMDIDTINMVDILSFFKRYPWGKKSFALTLDYLKKRIDYSKKKNTFVTKRVSSYTLYGFPWTFIFGYMKSLPSLAGEMVNQLKTRCPFPDCSDDTP
ncbi:hypothetical protein FXO38_00566 [Capsicum annuum]|nr:hypothetical protein FXO38_00566 [Capsicum annuum]